MTIASTLLRRVLAPAIAAVSLAGLLAAQPASAAPPLVTNDPGYPSPLAVVDGSTHVVTSTDVVCVAFVNNGPRTATKVSLSLAYVDAEGNVLGVDVISPRGVFPVGKRSAFSGGLENGNCHDTMQDRRPPRSSTVTYKPGRTAAPVPVAAVLVSAREIDYDDGTAFRADRVPHPGDHAMLPSPPPVSAAVPAGLPVVSPGVAPDAPFVVDDAVLAGFPYDRFGMYVCWEFTNHGTAAANKVRIDLELVDRTGAIGGIVDTYATGNFAPGVLIDNTRGGCTLLTGTWDADTFTIHPHGGAPVTTGRVIAVPVRIEFVDGTTWQSAHPPHIGDAAHV
jgi:hypothetical protein